MSRLCLGFRYELAILPNAFDDVSVGIGKFPFSILFPKLKLAFESSFAISFISGISNNSIAMFSIVQKVTFISSAIFEDIFSLSMHIIVQKLSFITTSIPVIQHSLTILAFYYKKNAYLLSFQIPSYVLPFGYVILPRPFFFPFKYKPSKWVPSR